MYQERNHTKSNQPKSVKGARKQVEELEAWLEIERDAIRAASELNNELIKLPAGSRNVEYRLKEMDAIGWEYLPPSLIERLTGERRETEESKRKWKKYKSMSLARDKKLFEVYKKYFMRIQASSIFFSMVKNTESLRYESDSGSMHGKPPRYINSTPLEDSGKWMRGNIEKVLHALEKARSNLITLERQAASRAVKKAQVATALGTTRNLAATIKNYLPADHSCPYCEEDLGTNFHADHIYPVSKGGQSREENMVNVCAQCNSEKSDLTLTRFILLKGLNRERVERNLNSLGKEF